MNLIEASEFHTIVTLHAGGVGSGRRPNFQKDTQDKDDLMKLHNHMVKQGFSYHHSSSENNQGEINHYYKNKSGDKASLVEQKDGDHRVSGVKQPKDFD